MQPAELDLATFLVLLEGETDFAGWRHAARRLALNGVPPETVTWVVDSPARLAIADEISSALPNAPSPSRAAPSTPLPLKGARTGAGLADGTSLPLPSSGGEVPSEARRTGGANVQGGTAAADKLPPAPPGAELKVPKEFVERAQTVFCHSDRERFTLLYGMLLRLKAEPNLMKIASDPAVRRFEAMEKSVRRDIHKMRAFVRFRKLEDAAGEERYVAWFEPEHHIVEKNAPFFVRRFTGMRWTILTPRASASWDGEALLFGPGAHRRDAPAEDASEELWRTYYQNIFNPARLKVKAMQAEMPKKYWRNLPEASLIPGMIEGAAEAAEDMIARMPSTPAPHHAKVQARHWPAPSGDHAEELPQGRSISELREQAKGCRRCPLWRDATQTVFGEGPERAKVIFVGEQPGDQEDIAGKPFVGPAGKVFDAILDDAGVDRGEVYVTNAVKHFKFEPRGKRRIHAKPNAGEVQACRWWMDRELALLKPNLVVALGATAALSLLGKSVAVTKMRGQVVEREDGLRVFLTIHPSFILRIREPEEKEAERARFLADMKAVKKLMG